MNQTIEERLDSLGSKETFGAYTGAKAESSGSAANVNTPGRWTFTRAQDFVYSFAERRYAIKHLIPYPALIFVYGKPKCGKSLSVEDWVHHIGEGKSYRGLRVNSGPVAYMAFEGEAVIRDRIEARRLAHERGEDVGWGDVRYTFDALNLIEDQDALIIRLREQFPDESR